MSFNIIVCVKQVPDTSDIKWTANNTIQREGLDSIINPFDVSALELANEIRDQLLRQNIHTRITAVTMGPKQAEKVLRLSIALGADNAYLMCDNKFSGADTLATSYTLAQFIKTIIPKFDLVICGQQAIDGDTAQVPSELAQKLDIPEITYVTNLTHITQEYIILNKETSQYKQQIKGKFPLLISTNNSDGDKLPNIDDYIRAQNSKIITLDANDIKANNYKIGLLGSPTQVKKAFKPSINRSNKLISSSNLEETTNYVLNEISKSKENKN